MMVTTAVVMAGINVPAIIPNISPTFILYILSYSSYRSIKIFLPLIHLNLNPLSLSTTIGLVCQFGFRDSGISGAPIGTTFLTFACFTTSGSGMPASRPIGAGAGSEGKLGALGIGGWTIASPSSPPGTPLSNLSSSSSSSIISESGRLRPFLLGASTFLT